MLDNPRWEKFCQAYAVDGNATSAYKKAGYKVKDDETAGSAARRLLQNVAVRNRIAELTAEAKEQALQSSIADIVEIRQRITQIMRGQAEVETKAADMIKAADLLTKIGGQQEPQRVQVQLTLEDKQARLQELLDANR
jgi:phage terminase small subunit